LAGGALEEILSAQFSMLKLVQDIDPELEDIGPQYKALRSKVVQLQYEPPLDRHHKYCHRAGGVLTYSHTQGPWYPDLQEDRSNPFLGLVLDGTLIYGFSALPYFIWFSYYQDFRASVAYRRTDGRIQHDFHEEHLRPAVTWIQGRRRTNRRAHDESWRPESPMTLDVFSRIFDFFAIGCDGYDGVLMNRLPHEGELKPFVIDGWAESANT
jgi:hypothetical protein